MEGSIGDDPAVRAAVRAALEEDRAWDDAATAATVPPGLHGRARIEARAEGVVAGLPVARAAFRERDPGTAFTALVEEGAVTGHGAVLARVEGPLASILSTERVALNFLGHLSGVATAARRFAEAIPAGSRTVLLDTRKTTPGLRVLERYAVRIGGGRSHRGDLAEAILVKENHAAAAGGAPAAAAAAVRAAAGALPVWVEVHDPADLDGVLAAGVDRVLLDNMDDAAVARCAARIAGACEVEVTGGVTPERLPRLAEIGVDYVSVGAITHGAVWLDVSLEVET